MMDIKCSRCGDKMLLCADTPPLKICCPRCSDPKSLDITITVDGEEISTFGLSGVVMSERRGRIDQIYAAVDQIQDEVDKANSRYTIH